MNFTGADRALREALGEKGLSIKGASSRGNVVQVGGLAKGTSAADVEVRVVYILRWCMILTVALSGLRQSSSVADPLRTRYSRQVATHLSYG